jgi:hypothetical protein
VMSIKKVEGRDRKGMGDLRDTYWLLPPLEAGTDQCRTRFTFISPTGIESFGKVQQPLIPLLLLIDTQK